MANNESSRPGSGKLDKIVAAILVFLIFGAGTYGIIREAGNATRTANAGQIEQTDSRQDTGNEDPAQSNEGAGTKASDANENKNPDKDDSSDKDSNQDKDAAEDGGVTDVDAKDPDDTADQGQDSDDQALIPADKTKLSANDVKKAFNSSKGYKIAIYTTAGSGSYIVTADTPYRRFPTTQAEPVGTIKAGSAVRVIAVSDDGAWAQISYDGGIYYLPMKDLKTDPDDKAKAAGVYVSGDITDDNRFAVIVFEPADPASSQYVTKADTPSKDAPSFCANDSKTFPAGSKVTVIAVSDNGWAKVTDGGKTYYVPKAYLDPVPSEDDKNDQDAADPTDPSSADSSDKTDDPGQTDKSADSDKSDKSGSDTSGKSGKTDKTDKSDSGKTDKSGKSDTSDKSGSSDKSGKSDKSGTSDKSGDNKTDKSDKSDKSGDGKSDKSGDDKSDKSGDGKKDSDKGSDKSSDKYPGTINMTEAKKLLKMINDYRKENGVPELKWSKGLEKASKTRAKEISLTAGSSQPHKRPNGKQWYTVNPDLMYGENIAYGQKTAEEVFKAWKKSSAHNKTMLDPEYKIFAAALYVEEGTKYTYYWIQEFGY